MAFFVCTLIFILMWTPLIGTLRKALRNHDPVGVFEVIAIPVVGFIIGVILGASAFGVIESLNIVVSNANFIVMMIILVVTAVIALGGVPCGFIMLAKWIGLWAWLAIIPIALGTWPWMTLALNHAAMH